MSDYPDYTQIFQLVGSDIMVPIDIQGAYIMLPVDIQAQYATLEISIVAQTVEYLTVDIAAQSIGYLSINLAASAITLDVNLAASVVILDINIKEITAGVTFNIGNIEGPFNIFIGTIQTVGVWTEGEWASKQGDNKSIRCTTADYTDYPVPGTKGFFAVALTFTIWGTAGEDRDLNQMGEVFLRDQTAGLTLAYLGGNGGGSVPFPSPIRIPSGNTLRLQMESSANHAQTGDAVVIGFEV